MRKEKIFSLRIEILIENRTHDFLIDFKSILIQIFGQYQKIPLTCVEDIVTAIDKLEQFVDLQNQNYQCEDEENGNRAHINGSCVFEKCFSVVENVHRQENEGRSKRQEIHENFPIQWV